MRGDPACWREQVSQGAGGGCCVSGMPVNMCLKGCMGLGMWRGRGGWSRQREGKRASGTTRSCVETA